MGVGNHEFDLGPDALAEFIEGFRGRTPFVSANLDVSAEPRLAQLAADGTLVASTVMRARGEEIGVVGLTTPALPSISSPRGVEVSADLAAITNAEVADLDSEGIDKIVLISHLQDIDEELALVPMLSGVDVVIGGGGGELLATPDDLLVPGDERVGD
jgi:5'-nucleotidase/UDP-sugar diphosphatase